MTATRTALDRSAGASSPRTLTVGRLAIVSAIVGALVGVQTLVTPSMVPAEQFSAPLTPMLATISGILLFLLHLAVVPMLALLPRIAASGALGRAGGAIAALGMVALAIAELVSIAAAHELGDTPITDAVGTGYSVGSIVLGVGEILLGVAVLRAGVWHGAIRALPLITGVFVFVPMTPALIVGAPWSLIALTVWSLLYLPLGVALVRTSRA